MFRALWLTRLVTSLSLVERDSTRRAVLRTWRTFGGKMVMTIGAGRVLVFHLGLFRAEHQLGVAFSGTNSCGLLPCDPHSICIETDRGHVCAPWILPESLSLISGAGFEQGSNVVSRR